MNEYDINEYVQPQRFRTKLNSHNFNSHINNNGNHNVNNTKKRSFVSFSSNEDGTNDHIARNVKPKITNNVYIGQQTTNNYKTDGRHVNANDIERLSKVNMILETRIKRQDERIEILLKTIHDVYEKYHNSQIELNKERQRNMNLCVAHGISTHGQQQQQKPPCLIGSIYQMDQDFVS